MRIGSSCSHRPGAPAPRLVSIAAIALAPLGCVATTAAPTKDGHAYIIAGSIFGTNVYNCHAGPPPTCYPVIEESR